MPSTDYRSIRREKTTIEFKNDYEDAARARAYAKLDFPGTYYLAFRDLPEIISRHARGGGTALDFGCGAGRSTRFLGRLGFTVVGVDIAHEMIRQAREIEPGGDYRLVPEGDLGRFSDGTFDLVLSAFTFDNVPTMGKKVASFREIGRVLKEEGVVINLVSSPDIYTHEWASFTTKDFPENKPARCGDCVRIVGSDNEDRRPVVDVLWPDEDYREVYGRAGLIVDAVYRPLGREDEPFEWINETHLAPWVIYVLRRADAPSPDYLPGLS